LACRKILQQKSLGWNACFLHNDGEEASRGSQRSALSKVIEGVTLKVMRRDIGVAYKYLPLMEHKGVNW
jgi:hypothetical protein